MKRDQMEIYNWFGNDHDPMIWDKLNEECGVFGVSNHPDAPILTYYGIHALQHRGQESAGIAATDGIDFTHRRGMGLVTEVFPNGELYSLKGHTAIGHTRYTTAGESKIENAQPLILQYRGSDLAIAHNGNLVNGKILRKELEEQGSIFQTTSDTEVIAHLVARSRKGSLEEALKEALNIVKGAFALVILTKDAMYAALDPQALRPMVLGKIGEGYVVSSETCAFDVIGAEYIRDVQPGELLVFDQNGMRTERYTQNIHRATCSFEYIYFARPDSNIDGINVHAARKRMGKKLALEAPVEADVVTGVPDSSISAAIGFAEETGIPYELGLIKNRYVGRTFIQPSQELRSKGVKMKLSAVRKVVEGKRVVMIDDSIVRGTTSKRIVQMIREAGATEVHVRISSPPVKNPCYYGIDTSSREELIAASMSVEEIRQMIGADSLHFLSVEGMLEAIGRPNEGKNRGHCVACFTGEYPTKLYDNEKPGGGENNE